MRMVVQSAGWGKLEPIVDPTLAHVVGRDVCIYDLDASSVDQYRLELMEENLLFGDVCVESIHGSDLRSRNQFPIADAGSCVHGFGVRSRWVWM